MMHTIHILLLLMLTWTVPNAIHAQVDPGLTGMILGFTDKAKSQYQSQIETMGLETAGHIWLKEEVEATTNYQRQFDEYLNSFRDIIAYAAQAYGFYHEIDHLCDNMGRLTRQIGDAPANAIAVALHDKRNDIYVSIINKSVGVVNSIRQVCLDKKMTEKERIELVFSIRPQLKQMNRDLAMLTKLVKSTNMAQIWFEISRDKYHKQSKADLAEEALGLWKINAKQTKPRR